MPWSGSTGGVGGRGMLPGMAVRGRTSSRSTVGGAVVVVALLVGSCSSHDTQPNEDASTTPATTAITTDRPAAPVDPRLGEIADEIGCSATTPVEPGDELAGAISCEVAGRPSTRIQRFEPSERASVERRFSDVLVPPGGGVECDGELYRYVVLGDDWLVVTNDRAVAGHLVVILRAGFIGPDDAPSHDRDVPDVCQ